ncbi:hypothetical protein [Streptomyces bobili]|uniref:hypothetical protein n=1 Tax=Streptomyces bobili TaxID=67280 RepID=UPI0037969F52
MFLAQSAPLYGTTGTLYGLGTHGVQPGPPLPYGHPDTGRFLASQQIHSLHTYRTVDLDELL